MDPHRENHPNPPTRVVLLPWNYWSWLLCSSAPTSQQPSRWSVIQDCAQADEPAESVAARLQLRSTGHEGEFGQLEHIGAINFHHDAVSDQPVERLEIYTVEVFGTLRASSDLQLRWFAAWALPREYMPDPDLKWLTPVMEGHFINGDIVTDPSGRSVVDWKLTLSRPHFISVRAPAHRT